KREREAREDRHEPFLPGEGPPLPDKGAEESEAHPVKKDVGGGAEDPGEAEQNRPAAHGRPRKQPEAEGMEAIQLDREAVVEQEARKEESEQRKVQGRRAEASPGEGAPEESEA